jgi:hypothetical protein
MRVISCAVTVDAVVERRKTVTRRWGWEHAAPGMRLRVVDRLRYRSTDPPQRTLATVEVVDVYRCFNCGADVAKDVTVRSLGPWRFAWPDEAAREGLPDMSIRDFAALLLRMAPRPPRVLTRIEWRYIEETST